VPCHTQATLDSGDDAGWQLVRAIAARLWQVRLTRPGSSTNGVATSGAVY